ncbi:hypothetical protein [Pontivivens insulae]|uniref:Uncharacterized protein n=1 Tax=Pontivivens insulae TaxID=1639689 RepID=A0A2R8AFS3_9RHOB|nr:hypothetical protein [Pontivivens insulae]RED10690.1 hypothetical protein DFR53_3510 [Pontivivens insulae]SPF31094.1 hypothetical protein POI8812_03445 [Pontivivens insulae]
MENINELSIEEMDMVSGGIWPYVVPNASSSDDPADLYNHVVKPVLPAPVKIAVWLARSNTGNYISF